MTISVILDTDMDTDCDDVGLAAAFLCGEGGRYITGATLDVNGGIYLR